MLLAVAEWAPAGGQVVGGAVASPESSLTPHSLTCGTSVADVPTFRGDAARTGRMPGPSLSLTPTAIWTYQADGPLVTSPALSNGIAYQGSASGTVAAIDLATGRERWHIKLDGAIASPTVVDNLLVVPSASGVVRALDVSDGRTTWTVSVGGELRGAPATVSATAPATAEAATEASVVVASTSGAVASIDARSGSSRWQTVLPGQIARSVALADGRVIVPVEPGKLVALDLASGTLLWQTAVASSGGVGTPAIDQGVVTSAIGLDGAPATDRSIAALDLATGQVHWRWIDPTTKTAYTPALAGGQAFVVDEAGRVTSIDLQTGVERWRAQRDGVLEALPIVTGETVVVASNRGTVAALDLDTGAMQWEVPIEGVPYAPVASCGWVLVPSNLGTLTAFWEPS